SDRIVVMSAGRIRQIGTPDAIYRRPQDRFVAGFVGDVNVLPGRLEHRSGERATVLIEGLRREVEAAGLDERAAGGAVDLFVRPDHLALRPAGEPGTLPARVATLVYQGSHVDLHAEVKGVGRVVVRVSGLDGNVTPAPGAEIGIAVPQAGLIAFPSEA
ncbi:MAG: TOBE domain-containing protein, partial [Janthinobacterium lividum]